MSNATFPAGAGAPPVNAPGHDGPGAPVCSEAERLPFRMPHWAQNARRAGRCLACVWLAAADNDAEASTSAARAYGYWHATATDDYRLGL